MLALVKSGVLKDSTMDNWNMRLWRQYVKMNVSHDASREDWVRELGWRMQSGGKEYWGGKVNACVVISLTR
jgi:hypothetical protein